MSLLKIAGGTLYDPAHGIDGEVRDLWVRDGIVCSPPTDELPTQIIDAAGLIVMPGGVDMHSHIAGPKVNVARKMRPEDKRQGPEPVYRTPLTRSGTTRQRAQYLRHRLPLRRHGLHHRLRRRDVPPLSARHAHEEFHDTPIIDKGFFLLFGNNHYVMKSDRRQGTGEAAGLRRLAACTRPRGTRIKIVNPGGVEVLEGRQRQHSRPRRATVEHFDVTARQIITGTGANRDGPGLPHPSAHPLQQPRHAGQLEDDARHHAGARRPTRPSDAHPVPQLRRRSRQPGHVLLEGDRVGRVRQRASRT